ncbi:nicotinamide riboside kinase [Aaosphaeria arxii CBS 175.79]|uniref:Nicotinamide riboside kinase n=1 Tax=Aaosphaeria arxii CBS 175.79 TaxID=1450172 RepID=A0A6A5XPJ5_9PLEO|nr:nicotinamide riboside kinase [Aaosphaeria arxii CBS 175.79]KAF2015185.1 nicotinamide riboside kinase [Aaosphaeria arxii CBS 175.79]
MARDLTTNSLSESILDLVRRIDKLLSDQALNPRQRILVALAGVPGSGKSTVSHALLAELAKCGIRDVAVVPMDGFHYTKKVLSTFEDVELAFQRRGAPFTFDADAFVHLIKTLHSTPVTNQDEPDLVIKAPSFDHALKDPVQDEILISSRNRLVIIEGNYTLLDEMPWRDIASLSNEKWFVDIPAEVARDRLAKRHLAAGIENSFAQAVARAEANDLPNGDMIRSRLIKPDVIIEN